MNSTDISYTDEGRKRGYIGTISGVAGAGKTSLAFLMGENPIFIRFEDGTRSIDAMGKRAKCFTQLIRSITDMPALWEQLTFIARGEHNHDLLIIDSVTQAETLFTNYLLANDPKKQNSLTTAYNGYYSGYSMLAQLHGRVREFAEVIANRGISVIFIAHCAIETIDPPDNPAYNRYTLRLHKNCIPHYVDNVDFIAFIASEITVDSNANKAYDCGDNRVIKLSATPFYIAKNRYNISEDIKFEFGINPLAGLIN